MIDYTKNCSKNMQNGKVQEQIDDGFLKYLWGGGGGGNWGAF